MNRDGLSAAGGWTLDAVLTLLAVTFLLFGSRQAAIAHVPPRRPLDAIVYVVLALAGVALMSRRRTPAALFALEVLLGAVYLARGYPYGPLLAVVGFAAYGFARRRDTLATLAATALGALALVLAYVIGYTPTGWLGVGGAVAQAGWVLGPALVGGLVREARAAWARADEEAAARHVEQERLRVARDVHDVVGHGLAVISLQAGVALHVLERRPDQARPALEAIRAASITALDELRVTLYPDPGDERSAGGLGRLGAILEQVRLAGLAVEVETVGVARALSPEVDLAALRVVQESLTNVLRHAGPASARVQLRYEPEAIVVAVSDDVPRIRLALPSVPARDGGSADCGSALGSWRRAGCGLGVRWWLAGDGGPSLRRGAGSRVLIRVVIADDQPLIRLGLRVLIETEPDLELAGEAEDGQAALAIVRRARPDVALLDIRMPQLDGLEVLKAIVADAALAETRVVMVTTFALDEYLFEALRAGASGFVVKDTDPAELLQAIRVIAAGESLLSPAMTRRLISAFATRPVTHAPDLSGLTARELEITALAGHGLSNDDIAARLVISPATARTHVSRAMIKLGARDRAQLVVLAHQAGLVTPPG